MARSNISTFFRKLQEKFWRTFFFLNVLSIVNEKSKCSPSSKVVEQARNLRAVQGLYSKTAGGILENIFFSVSFTSKNIHANFYLVPSWWSKTER